MALTTKFLRALDEALERRTEQLRRLIVPSDQGAPMKYTKKIRDKMKKKLLLAASAVLVHEHADKEFAKAVGDKHLRFIKDLGLRIDSTEFFVGRGEYPMGQSSTPFGARRNASMSVRERATGG